MDPVAVMEKSFQAVAPVVASTKQSQFSDKTPCTDWNVQQLLNHIIGGVDMFGNIANGSDHDASALDNNNAGDDPAGNYERAMKSTLEAWRQPGKIEASYQLPWGATMPGSATALLIALDTAIHGWDLARATGQDLKLDDGTVAVLSEFAQQTIPPGREMGAFGAEQEPAAGASAMDALAAFSGRSA